jgi:formylglycine-generating enzyme required for sulfatase activity
MIKKIILIVGVCMLLFACEKTTKPQETVATPTIGPASGAYLTQQNIQMSCATPQAAIRYTLDGTEPNATSTLYTAAFVLNRSATVKAKGFKEKMKESETASTSYTFRVSSISISPLAGNYNAPITVSMQYITPGTTILYTLDGSEPDETSEIYLGPFLISSNTTLKAKGFLEGWEPSETRSAIYVFTSAQPAFNITDGTYYTSLNLAMSTATPEAAIRYTVDGTEPDASSALYTEPVVIDASTVVKAKSFKTNWTPSATTTGNFELKATSPVFTPNPGAYGQPQNITITTTTPEASIYYTTDGSTPSESSTLYTAPVNLSAYTNLKAIAIRSGWTGSAVTTGVYSFNVAAPTFNPPGGSYSVYQMVTISCTTPDAEIRYTTNGTDPTASSDLYTGPVEIASNTTLKARAYRTGWNSSQIVTAVYTITQTQTVATPIISPQGGTYTSPRSAVITCSTLGATIRYTTDNSEPTQASEQYTIPLSISHDTTLKAKAFRSGWYDSQTASGTYVINFTLGEMVVVPGGTFTMGRTTGSGSADELPTHTVNIAQFYIGKYEVTQLEWQNIMGSNPSFFPGDEYRPVETVNWYAAVVYCNRKSISEGLTPVYALNSNTNPNSWGAIPIVFDTTWNTMTCDWTANGYRLPTEAEWEYAARGASNTPDFLYSGSNNAEEVAWYRANAGNTTHIIGHLMANNLGVYDMSGNVSEWCWDWYSSAYYDVSPVNNPTGPAEGSYRVARGGDYDDHTAANVRVTIREGKVPYFSSSTHGLRVARTIVRQ